ncbi:MAG: single-stranded DNA-binding protein [Treponema sp.]|nr:single-stranded DNA-binding protein [Treponema sp.]
MNNLNSVLIEGNMVRDPLYRTTPKGTPVCTFSLASNRYLRQDAGVEEEVSFFDIEAWTRIAEACNSQGKKGRGVRVVGRLKQDRWTDGEGKSRSKIRIVAEHVEFRPDFRQYSAMEMHASAIAGSGISAAVISASAGNEIDAPEQRYLEEEVYEESLAAPASVTF